MLALPDVCRVKFFVVKNTVIFRPGDEMLQVGADRHEKAPSVWIEVCLRVKKKSEALFTVTLN